ncbi:hypothetical protein DPMN_075801 [Dreissena polymorpha]|uniref:Carbohydrate sulfotransferase n=1 Tax=Dreissena polymorpha TaxID=45954 RepID=A0A9D3YIU5_DREPO|nr:hypothetical protein DPMN_075801 [Dreissena polymorpha]
MFQPTTFLTHLRHDGRSGFDGAPVAKNLFTLENIKTRTHNRISSVYFIASNASHHRNDKHTGFDAALLAKNVCTVANIKTDTQRRNSRLHVIAGKRVVFCPVEKVGSTFWRRVFYILTAPDQAKYHNPYDVPIKSALENDRRLFTLSGNDDRVLKDGAFSFLFVRNPFSRLLSAYIDKLVSPNPTYWKVWGAPAVTAFRKRDDARRAVRYIRGKPIKRRFITGHDVTFAEFLKLVINNEQTLKQTDPHLISVKRGCKPCASNFKYIGKMESFAEDAFFIMDKLGLNFTRANYTEKFGNLTTDDAITDSIRSPFSWKKDILKYVSWDKALQRIWLKLQMRGIIEFGIKLNLTLIEVYNINENQFITMAREAHRKSDSNILTRQKSEVRNEAFASVALTDLENFRDLFIEDFILFGYDPSPNAYFQRDENAILTSVYLNFTHLN